MVAPQQHRHCHRVRHVTGYRQAQGLAERDAGNLQNLGVVRFGLGRAEAGSDEAEATLVCQKLSDSVIANCVDALDQASVELDSQGASMAYRFHSARVLMRRVLETVRSRRGDAT